MNKLLIVFFSIIFATISYAGDVHDHHHMGFDINAEMLTSYMHEISSGSVFAFWVLIMITFIFGALHSLAPGHGNILVVSYFTSRKAKISHGMIMAAIIAVAHVISAIAIVFATNVTVSHISEEVNLSHVNIIKLISYFAIFVIGVFMLTMSYKDKNSCLCCGHNNHKKEVVKNKSYWMLAVSIGLIPCASSMLVLFFAMSQDMLLLGIYMVMSMSVGMGVTLAIIGVASIVASKKIIINEKVSKHARLSGILRYLGSAVIMMFGLVSLIHIIMEIN